MRASVPFSLVHLVVVGLAIGVCASPRLAEAQSARAAHVVGLFVDQPAVLVSRSRALIAAMPDGAVTVCAYATGVCRPIRAARPCSEIGCPSGGLVVDLDGTVSDVSDYPTDRDGLAREAQAIASDTNVRALYGYLPQPPPPTPPPTFHLRDEEWRFEGALGGGVGVRPESSVVVASLYGSFGWGVGVDWDDEDILQILFGNVLGADVHLRVLPSAQGGSPDQLSIQVGLAPRTLWAPEREPIRIGAGYLSLIPEVGVITHPTLAPAMYFGWTYPVSFALDPHVGVELRAWLYAVDDWIEGDEVAWLMGVDAAVLVF